jgi:hypothetical protein
MYGWDAQRSQTEGYEDPEESFIAFAFLIVEGIPMRR